LKKINLTIESDLKNVSLIGVSVNKICSVIPISNVDSYQVELCVVEAVNNAIIHAYKSKPNFIVDVNVSIFAEKLVIDVCDTGEKMDQKYLDTANKDIFDNIEINNVDTILDKGIGIPVIKRIMDEVTYKTENKKNVLTLVKRLQD